MLRDAVTITCDTVPQMRFGVLVACSAVAGGCSFPRPADVPGDGGASIDSAVDVDAGSCAPNTITCDDETGRYIDCSAEGTIEREIRCSMGCAPDEEKCIDIDPSNGLANELDLAGDAAAISFAGESLFDTDGNIFNGGVGIELPFTDVNGIRVYRFKSLEIAGTLKFEPYYAAQLPVAFVVDGDVNITGIIDVSADFNWGAAGGSSEGYDGEGHCGVSGYFGASPSPGGGGGGYAQRGGQGGSTSTTAGVAGGNLIGNEELVPLEGGCSGGTIDEAGDPSNMAPGGGGGGAIQIVSRTRIVLTGNGAIDASGGGGLPASNITSGGGGGGSGGSVLLEAPQILLDGASVVISTKGGGGAAVGAVTSSHGADGGLTAGPALGGTHPSLPDGGNGGTAASLPETGESTTLAGQDAGGGGGSVGRSRFNTAAGGINPQNGAQIYSAYRAGTIRTRRVP